MAKKNVVIGLFGLFFVLGGVLFDCWERWRPSVAICQHEDFVVDRFELLVPPTATKLAEQVRTDIASISPDTELRVHTFDVSNPWDFGDVYAKLGDFADAYRWHPDREDYYLHITTGTHVAQICLFLLCETRAMPGRLLQSSPVRRSGREPVSYAGRLDVFELDLAKYDRLAARIRARQQGAASLLLVGFVSC